MFLFLLSFCANTGTVSLPVTPDPLGVQGIQFAEKYGQKFLECVHTVISVMLPEIESKMGEQLSSGFRNPEKFNTLLQHLPFEPDNLGTGDCTFSACCSVLMLNAIYNEIGAAAKTSQDRLTSYRSILAAIATLTYFKHSDDFYSFICQLVRSVCEEVGKCTGQILIIGNEDVDKIFKKVLPVGSSQPEFFFKYRKKTLERMCEFMQLLWVSCVAKVVEKQEQGLEICYDPVSSGTTVPAEASFSGAQGLGSSSEMQPTRAQGDRKNKKKYPSEAGDSSVRSGSALPMSGKSIDKKQAQGDLLRFMKDKMSGNLVLKRGFREKGDEICTLIFPNAPDPLHCGTIKTDENEIKFVPNSGIGTVLVPINQEEQFRPRLVLQIPHVEYPDGEAEYLADPKDTIKHLFQREGRPLEEKAEHHAVTANLRIAASQNTWFSAKKGLKIEFSEQSKSDIVAWITGVLMPEIQLRKIISFQPRATSA